MNKSKDLLIRPALLDDRPELVELSKSSKFVRDFNGMSYRCGFLGKCLLAEYDNKIVGYIYYSILKTKNYTNLFFLLVKPEYRKLGIGKALLNCLIEESIKANKEWIKWSVHRTNFEALEFYSKLGFKSVGMESTSYKFVKKL